MAEKGLFEEEEGASEDLSMESELETPAQKAKAPSGGRGKAILLIGLLLVIGAYAANTFLLKEEEPAAPAETAVRIPITEAPVMENQTSVKVPSVAVARHEAKKPATRESVRKEEVKEAGGVTVIIGTYAAEYEIDAAKEKLRGTKIQYTSRNIKKKLMINRVLAKEVKDRKEVKEVLSDLKENGYDPFSVRVKGTYKIYAVSNLKEDISQRNKADLEKLGYTPIIEKREALVKVYQLIARAKDEKDAETLSERLKKSGFKPEINNK